MKKPLLHKTVIANFIFAIMAFFLFSRCHSGNANSVTATSNPPVDSAVTEAVDYKKMLADVVTELNKSCPKQLDSETQWDNSSFDPDTYVFQYNYTLINKKNSEVDTMALINYIRPILLKNAATNPDMKTFLASKVNLLYVYKDKTGANSFRVSITAKDYSN